MKKLIMAIMVATAVAGLNGCSSDPKTPEEAAQQFFEAMKASDMTALQKYVCAEALKNNKAYAEIQEGIKSGAIAKEVASAKEPITCVLTRKEDLKDKVLLKGKICVGGEEMKTCEFGYELQNGKWMLIYLK